MSSGSTPEVEHFWREFCAASGLGVDTRYDAYRFGDSDEMADRLAALVLTGPKRATAGLLADYGSDGDPMPEVGVYSIVLDGQNRPVCVVRTTDIEVKPLRDVDEAFAWDEGEGERTRDWWLAAHRAFFTRERGNRGLPFSDDMPAVFERFELVWPISGGAPPHRGTPPEPVST